MLSFQQTSAQTIEHNGWLFWSHQQKISERWQFSADVQVRSADKLNYLNTLLIRPGIGYKIADNQTITVGYTYFGTWDKENQHKVYEPENRIFEQFQIENEIQRTEITNRFRYEQRFLNLKIAKLLHSDSGITFRRKFPFSLILFLQKDYISQSKMNYF
nr:DUF2490 domain-containing protein [Dyadobacter frigoris]